MDSKMEHVPNYFSCALSPNSKLTHVSMVTFMHRDMEGIMSYEEEPMVISM